jgi:MFS transporter, PAT family, beta-lactamase induction signal transducer AmpG
MNKERKVQHQKDLEQELPYINTHRILKLWNIYFASPLLTILVLGFASGLPLTLTTSTLSAWLFESHVDIAAIGLFAVVGTPYTVKFLWAPIMDSGAVPVLSRLLGRRRGWLLPTQLLLMGSLALLALSRPMVDPLATAFAALLVAFASASQDIVVDAYRIERLSPEAQGQGAAMYQLGYRIGLLLSGAGGLFLAAYIGWQRTYFAMAAMTGVGVVMTLLAAEPNVPSSTWNVARPFLQRLRESTLEQFTDFTQHERWWLILLFIVVYPLADAFISAMTNPFLLSIGFSKTDIAGVVKIYGTIATFAGIFLGGTLTARFGIVRILFAAGCLHALANLPLALQAIVGSDTLLLAVNITAENFTGGIATVAFVACLSNLCNVNYTATQYALLSSLSAFGRTWLSAPAGFAEQLLGWERFFIFAALLAAPGLLLLLVLRTSLRLPAVVSD